MTQTESARVLAKLVNWRFRVFRNGKSVRWIYLRRPGMSKGKYHRDWKTAFNHISRFKP